MPFFYMDYWYLVLVVPTIIIALFAQFRVNSAFRKYSAHQSRIGFSAAEVTRRILDSNGLYNVKVERVSGRLTDHYDPKANVIRLSESVYDSSSIAAIGVAAHEAGHAVQYAEKYLPIKLRNSIIPIASLGTNLAPFIIIFGLLLSFEPLIWTGIILYSAIALFQLVTLPVEFNASGRAINTLSSMAILQPDEISGARRVLSAAALTYVAALLTTLANLLRFILLASRGNRRR
ncbi:MAG: zinc metallopeptidase [Ruminococcaceae bacterium]|nr:zinc metallopeptidase [Oscillospiraceae bacterium]